MAVQIGQVVLLDDQEFYIVLNETDPVDVAGGFLERRCFVSATTPGGFECIGSFVLRADGRWDARIAKVHDPVDDCDCTVVASGVERMDSIVALWKSRHDAFLGYSAL